MPRYRTAYSPEFRRQMVDLVRSGRTPEELAREFEPTAQSISTWVKQAERDAGKRVDGPTSAEREELGRLRRENHRLRQERDILAKAAAWFARESKASPNGFRAKAAFWRDPTTPSAAAGDLDMIRIAISAEAFEAIGRAACSSWSRRGTHRRRPGMSRGTAIPVQHSSPSSTASCPPPCSKRCFGRRSEARRRA